MHSYYYYHLQSAMHIQITLLVLSQNLYAPFSQLNTQIPVHNTKSLMAGITAYQPPQGTPQTHHLPCVPDQVFCGAFLLSLL